MDPNRHGPSGLDHIFSSGETDHKQTCNGMGSEARRTGLGPRGAACGMLCIEPLVGELESMVEDQEVGVQG